MFLKRGSPSCWIFTDILGNAGKINCGRVYSAYCVHIETSSLWAEFVNKNRCISVRLVSEPRRRKAYNFDNFENSHNSFLWPEYYSCENGFHVRLSNPSVFTFPSKDSTPLYKKCVHPEITFLALVPWGNESAGQMVFVMVSTMYPYLSCIMDLCSRVHLKGTVLQ